MVTEEAETMEDGHSAASHRGLGYLRMFTYTETLATPPTLQQPR